MKKVRINCIKKTTSKLALVKLIKEVSGLGLIEAKDIADTFDDDINKTVEFEISMDKSIEQFRKDLNKIDGKFFVNGGTEFDREYKLLILGLGEQEDYVNFISDNLNYFSNQEEIIRILLNKEDLIEIITNKLDCINGSNM